MTLEQARQALKMFCKRSMGCSSSFIELHVPDNIAHVLIEEFPNLIFSKGRSNFTARCCNLSEDAMSEKKMLDNFLCSAKISGANTQLELHYDFRDMYPQLEFQLLEDGKTMIILREPFEKIKSKVHVTTERTTPP